MAHESPVRKTLSIVVPCYNEERTLAACIKRVLAIADDTLGLEIVIVDDCSSDGSHEIAQCLAQDNPQVVSLRQNVNSGKGAALRTGFALATGDFVAVLDADLEYDPHELKRLIRPLVDGHADVVLGSRFLTSGPHRVLYFWHSLGNRFLTFLSNMMTDINVTDMETGYKIFRREVIQKITIEENRFGFEPEVIAKVAALRVRIFETGISYHGRTYTEGKKIGVKDGFRAVYCVLKYNLYRAHWALQFPFYLASATIAAFAGAVVLIAAGTVGAISNIPALLAGWTVFLALDYLLSLMLIFRHRSRWTTLLAEVVVYMLTAGVALFLAMLPVLHWLQQSGWRFVPAAFVSFALVLIPGYVLRRHLIFRDAVRLAWQPRDCSVRGESPQRLT